MSDTVEGEGETVTEDDAIVQTPNGERYRVSELSKSGVTNDENS